MSSGQAERRLRSWQQVLPDAARQFPAQGVVGRDQQRVRAVRGQGGVVGDGRLGYNARVSAGDAGVPVVVGHVQYQQNLWDLDQVPARRAAGEFTGVAPTTPDFARSRATSPN